MQRNSALLAGSNGVNGKLLTGVSVAAHKNIRFSRLIGQRICLYRPIGIEFHFRSRQKRAPIGFLANAVQHRRAGRFLRNGIIECGCKAAIRVFDRHALAELDTGALAVSGHDLRLTPTGMNANTVPLTLAAIFFAHWHIIISLKAVQIYAVSTAAGSSARHISADIAPADDYDLSLQLHIAGEIHLLDEINTGHNTCGICAGNVQISAGLQTNSHIESLKALVAQLLDCNVPAHLYAAAEFHAHFTKNVNLRLYHVLLQPEAGNGIHQHTAGAGRLIKYHRLISLFRQEKRTAHTGRARTDDRDLLVVGTADLVHHRRHIAGSLIEVMVSDKTLDLVNGHRLIHRAAGTLRLAAMVADAATDRRERVLLLDQGKGLPIFSLRRQTQITLHGNMGGTGGLTGRGAGGYSILPVFPVIYVPVTFMPYGIRHLTVFRLFQRGLAAQLLTQLQRVTGTALHTLATGHAFAFVDLRHKVGADHVPCAVQHTHTQAKAGTGTAVADGGALARFLNIGHVVHQAVLLGTLEDFIDLLASDLTGTSRADIMLRTLAHLNTHILLQMAAAVSQCTAGGTAGARRH